MRQYPRVITWARTAAIVGFLALGVLIYYRYTQLIEQIGTQTSAQRIAAATTQLLGFARDLDSSARGYLASGREESLAHDAETRSQISEQIERLEQALPEDAEQRQHARTFVGDFSQVLEVTERMVSTRRQSGFDAAQGVMLSANELDAVSHLRATGDALVAAARQRVSDERSATQRGRLVTGYLILVSFFFAIGMLTYAGVRLRGELRRRGEAEDALRRTHAETERQVTLRTEELRAANAELESRERRLRLVTDFGMVHLLTTTGGGWCEYMSRGFDEVTGLGAEQVLGLGWMTAVSPDDRDALLDMWRESSDSSAPFEADFRLRTTTGEYRGFKLRAMPVVAATGKVQEWFCAMIDLHDQQQAEAGLALSLRAEQSARADAERANRIRDDLLATVSHELRTPLNAIVGWAQILKIDGGENHERAVEAIERNAFVQTRLIDDLLDMSRMAKGQFTLKLSAIDLRSVVQAALETIGPAAAAKGIAIETHATEAVKIRGDEARLQQITWNLLSNAVKFTPTGGKVTVEVSHFGTRARLRVTDTGEGIDPAFLAHVFEPFRQADARSTRLGLGLGLAIVRQLVELHGGTVLATSDGLQQGASFTVLLPLSPTAVMPSVPASTAAARALNLRVLVAEDDVDAAVTLSALLTHRGCHVDVAHTAGECVKKFGASRPDILLCDIGLPDGDGYSLLQRLRQEHDGQPVPAIALSAFARDEDRARAADVGFAMYLTKPYEVEQLIDHIRRVAMAG
jgi:PAS domain S-box-containing protein